ncbi:hypothetical protein OS493_003221 [Desmophyllum pertusum]|uniref:Uncharacterized protein n=1 Tax=Desmophyllum pertusum TaxID=174260 RepID=A0A9W9YJX6_9CNID|nr:hypothetical protein OS493_003221 [Desmophyllum pertusum]
MGTREQRSGSTKMVEVSRDEGAVNGAKCLDVTEELSTGVHNTVQGAEGGCTPQCQDMKDLPEKEPKKTKRRRKKRTGKQTLVENLNSPSVSAPNETQHKDELDQGTLQTQSLETSDTDHEDEKEKATEMKAENATTRKSRKDEQAKLSAEEIPRTEASIAEKGKVEEEQTEQAVPRVVKRKIRCRATVKKKKPRKLKIALQNRKHTRPTGRRTMKNQSKMRFRHRVVNMTS